MKIKWCENVFEAGGKKRNGKTLWIRLRNNNTINVDVDDDENDDDKMLVHFLAVFNLFCIAAADERWARTFYSREN